MADTKKPQPNASSRKPSQEDYFDETSAMFTAEHDEDVQSMKVAWIGALIFHFVLFITVFPSMGGTAFDVDEREVTVVKRYKPPTPPKDQPKKKVVKKKAASVPIPDPTPDEPEPLVTEEVEFIEDVDLSVDTDFVVGMPSGGPPVIDQGPLRVGGDIQEPDKLFNVDPEYPELARRARMEGPVIIQATIDEQGNVVDTEVLRGLGLGLNDAAMAAVQQWKYTPTTYNGRPVSVLLTVTVQFVLIQN